MSVRTGNSPTPDATWSSFGPASSGASVGANARYLQYRVVSTHRRIGDSRPAGYLVPGELGPPPPDDPADDHRRERGSGRQRDLGHDHLDHERALELARGLRDLGRVAEPDHQRCGPGDLALGEADGTDLGYDVLLPGPVHRRGHQRRQRSAGGGTRPRASPRPTTTPPDDHGRDRHAGAAGTSATITWTTNEPGHLAGGLRHGGQRPEPDAQRPDAGDVPLGEPDGPDPGTTYFFRVRSTDAATNEATSPVGGQPAGELLHGQPRHDPADRSPP